MGETLLHALDDTRRALDDLGARAGARLCLRLRLRLCLRLRLFVAASLRLDRAAAAFPLCATSSERSSRLGDSLPAQGSRAHARYKASGWGGGPVSVRAGAVGSGESACLRRTLPPLSNASSADAAVKAVRLHGATQTYMWSPGVPR